MEELEKLYGDYNVHNLCDALMVPRGTLYNHIKRNKRDNSWYAQRRENLREQIQEIYDDKEKRKHKNHLNRQFHNSVIESFFSNMKREELYRTKYRSEKGFRTAMKEYIRFYNEERPHSKNNYKTPSQKEAEYFSKQAENRS